MRGEVASNQNKGTVYCLPFSGYYSTYPPLAQLVTLLRSLGELQRAKEYRAYGLE